MERSNRSNWFTEAGADREAVKVGCLMRIADSLEIMQKNYAALMSDRDYYKGRLENVGYDRDYYKKSAAGLRGAITRMKRKGK